MTNKTTNQELKQQIEDLHKKVDSMHAEFQRKWTMVEKIYEKLEEAGKI